MASREAHYHDSDGLFCPTTGWQYAFTDDDWQAVAHCPGCGLGMDDCNLEVRDAP